MTCEVHERVADFRPEPVAPKPHRHTVLDGLVIVSTLWVVLWLVGLLPFGWGWVPVLVGSVALTWWLGRHRCSTCGGALDPSAYGGYLHRDDADDDHTPTRRKGSHIVWSKSGRTERTIDDDNDGTV